MHEYIDAYRRQNSGWDELRAQRVFKAVTQELNSPNKNRIHYSMIAGIGVAAAAVLILALGFLFKNNESMEEVAPSVPAFVFETDAPVDFDSEKEANDSVLTLAGIGQVTVSKGADVSILEQRTGVVHLEQTEGRALYDIIHQDGRTVQVRAAGIVIKVVGTTFWVTVDESVVSVEVERGIVAVDDGKQVVSLEANETISMGIPEKKTDHLNLTESKRKARRRLTHHPKKTDDLFYEADQARKAGDLKRAAKILRHIISLKESRFSIASAQFVLGKVERGRGNHAGAAEAFFSCSKHAPNRALGEDALAEAALSFNAAGNRQKARHIADVYLKNYPQGIYVVKMRRLFE